MKGDRSRPPQRHWFSYALVSFVLGTMAVYGARPLQSYQVIDLGGGVFEVGIVTATFSAASLVTAIPIGRMIDRGFIRGANEVGMLLVATGCVLSAFSTDLLQVYLASAVLGMGHMMFLTAVQSMVPVWSERSRMDVRFGHVTLVTSAGQIAGLALLALVSSEPAFGGTTSLAMLAAAAIALMAVAPGLGARGERVAAPASSDPPPRRVPLTVLLRRPGMRPAILSSLAVLTGLDILAAYLPVLGEEHGLDVTTVAVLLGVRTTASLIARACLTWVLRAYPLRILLICANLIPGVAMVVMTWASEVVLLGVIMLIAGFFWGIGQPITMFWVARAATAETHATAVSLRLAGNRAGQMVIPALAGAVAGGLGLGAVFLIAGVVLIGASASTWATTRPGGEGAGALSGSR